LNTFGALVELRVFTAKKLEARGGIELPVKILQTLPTAPWDNIKMFSL
jgi:hypothetical protein